MTCFEDILKKYFLKIEIKALEKDVKKVLG